MKEELTAMRLDKFLSEMMPGSRSQVKALIRSGQVSVNGSIVKSPEQKVDETKDLIRVQGEELTYRKYVYYMLNKPAGVVSATRDNVSRTVLELLKDTDRRLDLFPVGRLDKDTEGLLLLTNDGELAHRLLSPKKHVDKTYHVTAAQPMSAQDLRRLEEGVDIGEERLTRPATVRTFPAKEENAGIEVMEGRLPENEILLTIQEGKFHQVKRMLSAVGNSVTALKRVSFAGLLLDPSLQPGEYRELTMQEVERLHEN